MFLRDSPDQHGGTQGRLQRVIACHPGRGGIRVCPENPRSRLLGQLGGLPRDGDRKTPIHRHNHDGGDHPEVARMHGVCGSQWRSTPEGWNGDAFLDGTVRGGPTKQQRGRTTAWVAAVHEHFRETTLWPCLSPTEQAQVRSQSGPLASVPLTALPVHRVSRMDSEPFRVFLLRRLRLPLPLSVRRCSCGRLLDSYGHHRATCSTVGVLSRRGFAVENAVAQVCREGGARVSTNIFLRDLDLDLKHASMDGRRLEVVAEGLSLFGGSQLALDATWVSAFMRSGSTDGTRTEQTASPCEKRGDTKRRLIQSSRAGTVACGWW